jgi:hypothetical protein
LASNRAALRRRSIGGACISVELFHLFRYVDGQAFRFDNRKPLDDEDHFRFAMRKIVGERLTYPELTRQTPAAGPSTEVPF